LTAQILVKTPVFDFRAPDYVPVFRDRSERLKRLRAMKPDELAAVKVFYRDNPVAFINDWMMTVDPRNVEIGLPSSVPFLLFPKQSEFVDWVYALWRGREDGLAEKSRDMGASWLCCAIAVHMWLFYRDTIIGFGSRKEEYVDEIGNLKALLPKIRMLIDNLPREFKPVGWEGGKFMLLNNPENGSSIIGEAGDNIGRGARTSVYFKDESAFYERADKIEAAISQTSNCKIDISTPNGSGNPFYRKRHGGKVKVFTFHWTDDPRKDKAWYDKQVNDLDPVILAQEVDIDYNASVSNAWIDGSDIERAFGLGPADVEAIGPSILGVDAAHFGDDESVICHRKGRLVVARKCYSKMDGHDLAGVVNDYADECDAQQIVIELDGPGVSCYDTLKRGRHASKVQGIHTGARVKDGKNYNVRARAWRALRDWYINGPVSSARDGEFKSQAGAMRYSYKDGLLLMENKKEYKARMNKSPDRADAEMLTHAVSEMPALKPPPIVVPSIAAAWNR